ncbi:hypothetical protein [Halobacterium sp. R2-5]|uniref:DUF7513 family protein n=1 Tax=Halobacterium sp. R2-5 TaxID=2715751 RepID=UPI0014239AFA|nr:hypothetical protein [Halobacterium sp. R2-5]NIB98774.1 hypothetical protein [Halobacterium sp. R2-5]
MSLLEKYTKGWSFRTKTPSFQEGDEISVFVTGVEAGTAVARVGDTKLRLPDADPALVDKRVLLRVTSFDDDEHVGEAEYLETVGESAF